MSDGNKVPDHCCPGCGMALPYQARYPWHFCVACRNMAADVDGRSVEFYNPGVGGGLAWHYADDPERTAEHVSRVVCYIVGRPVVITEARFGGIVAQPAYGPLAPMAKSRQEVYLTNAQSISQACEELVSRRRGG